VSQALSGTKQIVMYADASRIRNGAVLLLVVVRSLVHHPSPGVATGRGRGKVTATDPAGRGAVIEPKDVTGRSDGPQHACTFSRGSNCGSGCPDSCHRSSVPDTCGVGNAFVAAEARAET
jgi:hypothetical protein